jgi:hypothetical protein
MFSLSSCLFYPARLLLPSGVFFDLDFALAGIGYTIPHKTHLKGYLSAIRCTGRVNVQGQTIGTKKGTQSPFRFCTGRVYIRHTM